MKLETSKKFPIMKRDGSMEVPSRTHHDLKSSATLGEAALAAREVYEDVLSVKEHALSLDQTEFDFNDATGEVLLKDFEYKGRSLTGSVSEDHMEMVAREGEVEFRYGISEGEMQRTEQHPRSAWNGKQPITRETFEDNGAYSSYEIETSDTENPFADYKAQNHDIPRPGRKPLHNWRLTRQADDTIGESPSPKRPADIEAMKSRQVCANAANKARPLIESLYDAALALDQTEFDKNPREGEVLFENFEFEGRRLNGTILPRLTSNDDWFDSLYSIGPGKGRDEAQPYLRAHCPDTNETFEALIGSGENGGDCSTDQIHWDRSWHMEYSDYHKRNSFENIFIYDDGKQRVRIQDEIGNKRSSVVVSEAPAPLSFMEELLIGRKREDYMFNNLLEREG